LDRAAIEAIGASGVRCVNFLTDDPWNRVVCGQWFRDSLQAYDLLITPRSANLEALRQLGRPRVARLPFGFDHQLFFPEAISEASDALDVAFVGGADVDRVALLQPLLKSGLKVRLFGAYWERYASTKAFAGGGLTGATLRELANQTRVSLCIVRRKNRDGHVMRSLEAAACGECMLVERTPEHMALFGADDACVRYFDRSEDIPALARALCADASLRWRLRAAVTQHIHAGKHSYADRLQQLLALLDTLP
jgi:spore maturation protein CgeB